MTAIRAIGAALIVAIGVVHLTQLSYMLDEQTYLGVLFILTAVGAAVVALWLLVRESLVPWSLGALISACTLVGFLLSRTVGLPGFDESEWTTVGLVSLALEGSFLALFAAVAARLSGSREPQTIRPAGRPLAAGPQLDRR